jgi:hypothetical protein
LAATQIYSPRNRRPPFRLALLLTALVVSFGALPGLTQAQTSSSVVRVSSLSGNPRLTSQAGGAPSRLQRGAFIAPGDLIETGAGGRVVLSLSDGSLIVIYPNSRVRMKGFRQAGSLRELADVLMGRLRLKINKLGGRPNPYHLSSPTATIAVRGTEFTVNVAASGETRVVVFEGLVEVTSRFDPLQRRLLEPGRSVIVRPSGDLVSLTTGAGSELNGLTKSPYEVEQPTVGVQKSYLNLVNRLMVASDQPTPFLFAAFSDAHFDSLDNPAYAIDFAHAEGRAYFLPSLNAPRSFAASDPLVPLAPIHRFDTTLTSQATFFLPAGSYVIGGGASLTRGNLEGAETDSEAPNVATTAATQAKTFDLSLVAARRLGAERRTGVGLKFDYLSSRLSNPLTIRLADVDFGVLSGQLNSETEIDRKRLTAGVVRDFGRTGRLGVFGRYGIAQLKQANSERGLNQTVFRQTRDFRAQNDFAEAGWLWRGALTSRLFYGVRGSLLREWIHSRQNILNSPRALGYVLTQETAERAVFGGGVGYALRPRTVFSFDLTNGGARVALNEQGFAPDRNGVLHLRVQTARVKSNFLAAQIAAQTELNRRFLFQASLLRIMQTGQGITATPGTGPSYSFFRRFYSTFGFVDYSRPYYVSNFSAGWRVKPDWLVQYILSADYGRSAASHTLMLRYNFDFKEKD